MDINVVLDELTHEPLGFGQGEFVIHQGFHYGVRTNTVRNLIRPENAKCLHITLFEFFQLFGLVGTLFVMMSNKTAKLGKQFPQI